MNHRYMKVFYCSIIEYYLILETITNTVFITVDYLKILALDLSKIWEHYRTQFRHFGTGFGLSQVSLDHYCWPRFSA